MSTIYELLPEHEVLLSLEVEELAWVVLEYLRSLPKDSPQFGLHNFSLSHTVAEYPGEYQKNITNALREAWMWLKREGFIISTQGFHPNMVSITRKGEDVENSYALEAYRKAKLLPKKLLHPVIAQKVYHLFLRGDYDTGIFQAYKEVEIAVRNAGDYTAADYGVDLMRKAFQADNGPLTDQNQLKPEREATAHMFAGAIGLYKNPQSHRNVPVTAEEAVKIIMLASHLLGIVDSRDPASNAVQS